MPAPMCDTPHGRVTHESRSHAEHMNRHTSVRMTLVPRKVPLYMISSGSRSGWSASGLALPSLQSLCAAARGNAIISPVTSGATDGCFSNRGLISRIFSQAGWWRVSHGGTTQAHRWSNSCKNDNSTRTYEPRLPRVHLGRLVAEIQFCTGAGTVGTRGLEGQGSA